jgi:hypothetical protein
VFTIFLCSYLYVHCPAATAVIVLALEPNGQSKVIQAYDFGGIAAAQGLEIDVNYLEGTAIYVA